jgi:hypothetical protein
MYPTVQDTNNVILLIVFSILLGTLFGYGFTQSRNAKKSLEHKAEEINGTIWSLMEDRYNNTIEDIDYILNNLKNIQTKFSVPFAEVEVIPVNANNPKIADLIGQLKNKQTDKDWFDDYLSDDL